VGRKKKDGPPPDEGGPETPEWIVTFSDMISLLVTFFVLLLTFSSLESDDILKIQGAMTGTRGSIVSKLANSMVKAPVDRITKIDPIRGGKDAHSRPPEELPDEIAEHGFAMEEDQIEMDLSSIGDGLEIPFGEPCFFAPGSAELPPELAKRASELADIVSHYPYMVLLEGFTDNAFRPSDEYPDEASLSLARASAVADVMTGTTDLEKIKIQLAGHGSRRAVGDNETALGRRENRRVTVRLLTLPKAYQDHLKSERQRKEADGNAAAEAALTPTEER
jgi:chemotaxis protein MotB